MGATVLGQGGKNALCRDSLTVSQASDVGPKKSIISLEGSQSFNTLIEAHTVGVKSSPCVVH